MATDSDGNLTNAGEILYYQENYSGNKDNLSLNFGVAATFSIPLGGVSRRLFGTSYNPRKIQTNTC